MLPLDRRFGPQIGWVGHRYLIGPSAVDDATLEATVPK